MNISETPPSASTSFTYNTWADAQPEHTHRYLHAPLFDLLGPMPAGTRVLDVGCGNGFLAGKFRDRGCKVVGIDLGDSGIAVAKRTYPDIRFELVGADDHLLKNLGEVPFDLVVSTEVVEHLYDPRAFVRGCHAATRAGGKFACSTPYHGYLKNLLISLAGKWDHHADPLWPGGHIKLFSRKKLSRLLVDAGFADLRFRGAGGYPYIWKSMILSGTRPAASPVD